MENDYRINEHILDINHEKNKILAERLVSNSVGSDAMVVAPKNKEIPRRDFLKYTVFGLGVAATALYFNDYDFAIYCRISQSNWSKRIGGIILKNRTKLPNLYLAIILIFMYLPILIVIIYSFNENKLTAIWSGFSLKWYAELLKDKDLMEALKNSLILGVLSCFCAGVIGTIGAVGMARMNYKTKGIMEYVSMLPIMIPEIILGMVFLAFFSAISLPFGMTTLVIAHTTFCIPYIYMMVKARLVGMDPTLLEAARDLGASEIRAFWDITLPLIMPAVASGSLLAFAMSFDDVVISVLVTNSRINTLPIKVFSRIKFGVSPEINALSTIMLSVTLIIILSVVRINKKNRGGSV